MGKFISITLLWVIKITYRNLKLKRKKKTQKVIQKPNGLKTVTEKMRSVYKVSDQ